MSIGTTTYTPSSGSAPVELFEDRPSERAKNGSPVPRVEILSFSSIVPELQALIAQIDQSGKKIRFQDMTQSGVSLLESLSSSITHLQERFTESLYRALRQIGVDISLKLTLRLDTTATLVLSGEHPEKDAIQDLLKQHPEFSVTFAEIATQSAVLRDLRSLYTLALYEQVGDSYAALAVNPGECIYQLSLKGEMNHFYFTR